MRISTTALVLTGLAAVSVAAETLPNGVDAERFPRYARMVERAGQSPIPAADGTAQAVAQKATALTAAAELPVIPWHEAPAHLAGPPVTVEGTIVEAFMATDYLCLLRFDLNREKFYIALFDRAYDRMNLGMAPTDFFVGRTVRVSGRVSEYEGRPNMTVRDPDAVEVID